MSSEFADLCEEVDLFEFLQQVVGPFWYSTSCSCGHRSYNWLQACILRIMRMRTLTWVVRMQRASNHHHGGTDSAEFREIKKFLVRSLDD